MANHVERPYRSHVSLSASSSLSSRTSERPATLLGGARSGANGRCGLPALPCVPEACSQKVNVEAWRLAHRWVPACGHVHLVGRGGCPRRLREGLMAWGATGKPAASLGRRSDRWG